MFLLEEPTRSGYLYARGGHVGTVQIRPTRTYGEKAICSVTILRWRLSGGREDFPFGGPFGKSRRAHADR